jgi:hypothetical protein
VRDHDSHLAVAVLLRRAVDAAGGRSVDTGEELAARLGKKGVGMRYGTRRGEGGGWREVDLWDDVEGSFPSGDYR